MVEAFMPAPNHAPLGPVSVMVTFALPVVLLMASTT
jgi:hypothetical protein